MPAQLTQEDVNVIDDALQAAYAGIAASSWSIFGPSVDSIGAEYTTLRAATSAGWTDESVRKLGAFMLDARAAAGESWPATLDARHAAMGERIRAAPFADPTHTAELGPTSLDPLGLGRLSESLSAAVHVVPWIVAGIALLYLAPLALRAFKR